MPDAFENQAHEIAHASPLMVCQHDKCAWHGSATFGCERENCGEMPPKPDAIEPQATAVKAERDAISAEARRYADFYSENSDGRNTFVIFAEWVESGRGR